MNPNVISTRINDLRAKNSQTLLEAITITIVALVINSMLPLILVKYVYANKQLLQAPPIFDYIAVVSFAVTVLYFLYAFLSNFKREREIFRLMNELDLSEVDELLSDEELKELENIVDEALNKSKKTKTTKKSTRTKKTAKKTSAKKTSRTKKTKK